jgi:hypothetical protein
VTRTFQIWAPDEAVAARNVVAGGRVFYKGTPFAVYAVFTLDGPNPITEIVLGDGLWWEPRLKLPADDLIMTAVALPIVDLIAAWSYPTIPDDCVTVPPERHELPTRVDDGVNAVLALTDADTLALAATPGSFSWDMYARTVEQGWQRIVEGTLTVIRGDTRNELSPVPTP